jgi:sugar lactone lactonase YvrE
VDVLNRRGRSLGRLKVPAGHPAAVAVAGDGTIYVGTTAEASAIHRFSPTYQPLGSWGTEGREPGRLNAVTAIGALADGNVAVACARTDLGIQIFTPTGEFVRGFGSHEMGAENFSLPSGLVGTPDGRVWIVDEIRRVIRAYDQDGNPVTRTGTIETAGGEFSSPSSLAYDGKSRLAVTDRKIGRVQVFEISQ